jgi:hypothetical protein
MLHNRQHFWSSLSKAAVVIPFLLAFQISGCQSNVQEFSQADIIASKQFVMEKIIPMYPSRRIKSTQGRLEAECEIYKNIISRLEAADSPNLLKWQKPEIELRSATFIFFIPRSRTWDLCTDNCLSGNDIPVRVMKFQLQEKGSGEWQEDDMVLWNGKWPYRTKNPCEYIKSS